MAHYLKRIGLMGGMGPEATAYFMRRVIALTAADDDVDHVPFYVDMNPQVPSRLAALIDNDGANPGPVLAQMARGLTAQGAKALVMPCNTAHHYADYITDAVATPLLNMLNLSANVLAEKFGEGASIGMLSSPATDTYKIFQSAFDKLGLTAVYPKDADHVLSLIRKIKADGPSADIAQALSELAHELENIGVKALLIGCSEFSIIGNDIKTSLPLYDTVDIAAREVIRFSGAKLRVA